MYSLVQQHIVQAIRQHLFQEVLTLASPIPLTIHIILGIQFASILLSDYGDAPVSYGVPAHILDNCSKLRIGALIDGEASAANSVGADGDNLNGLNDEDGISTLPLLNGGTGSYSVVVNNILNNYGSAANLYGWIDFNGDGQFQSSEFASTTVANGFSGSKTPRGPVLRLAEMLPNITLRDSFNHRQSLR